MIVEIPLSDLRLGPKNPRGVYRRVAELAESIRQYGLLQNLVVREAGDHFEVIAGNRRLLAIQLLASKRKWSRLVPCLPIDTPGNFEALAENVQQESVFIWRLGYRYLEMMEGGYSQQEIAARISRAQGHVSIAAQIARGLAPKVVRSLEKLPPGTVSNNQLLRMSKLFDTKLQEAEEEKQLEMLAEVLEGKQPRRVKPKPAERIGEQAQVWRRYRKLRDSKCGNLPSHATPYVQALVRYLRGDDARLYFK